MGRKSRKGSERALKQASQPDEIEKSPFADLTQIKHAQHDGDVLFA